MTTVNWMVIIASAIWGVTFFFLLGWGRFLRRFRVPRLPRGSRAVMSLMAVFTAAIGGAKFVIRIDDPYIYDTGSYLTNDVAHIAIGKRSAYLPEDTEILVYARELASTNAADWVRLEPHLTFADHPFDYTLVNATNYSVMVAADYVPGPTVHTNGVWEIKGFFIPGADGKMTFKQTRTTTIEDNTND